MHLLYKRNSQRLIDSCYTTLDTLPIYNWWQLSKGDLSYLFKSKRAFTAKEQAKLVDIYKKLSADYINTFGISKQFKIILEAKKQVALNKVNFVLTEDRVYLTRVEIAEAELMDIMETVEVNDFNDTKALIDKQMGFRLNPHEISVIEYQGYINSIQKEWQKS